MSPLQFLVLDEADRLLDMGFEAQLTRILEIVSTKTKSVQRRQTILASATMSDKVKKLGTGVVAGSATAQPSLCTKKSYLPVSSLRCASRFVAARSCVRRCG